MAKKLWHQIWHGDSIELCSKFRYGRVDCVITDPPFGVDNKSRAAVTAAGKKNTRRIANDESPEVAIKTFNSVMDVLLPRTKDNADLYVFTNYLVLEQWLGVARELQRHDFHQKAILVWEKDGPGMGNVESLGMGHEFVLYLKKGDRPISSRRRNGVYHYPQVRPKNLIHPHEKPTSLLEEFIRASTDKGDFLVDPFGGSGSLVRAARNCGRSAVAIELDQKNYEISQKKLELELTGGFDFGEE
jgi:DNA modification methylase